MGAEAGRRGCSASPELADVASDLQDRACRPTSTSTATTAGRLGITPAAIDNALYNAFGQRLISTIFTQSNQYRVVLEVKPEFQRGPAALDDLYVTSTVPASRAAGAAVDRSRASSSEPTPLAINHVGQFPAATVSFNLAPGASLGDAVEAIEAARGRARHAGQRRRPTSRARRSRSGLARQRRCWLILAAIVTMYIVLGVLYESFIHPITILSTLPSAGVGALLALMIAGNDLGDHRASSASSC